MFEAGYNAMANAYRVTLDATLKVRGLVLLLTLATFAATLWAFAVIKKGFLPIEDTSILIVRTEAPADIAFNAMIERQRLVAEAVLRDPDVLYINSNVAVTNFNSQINRGFIYVQLKPRKERADRASISEVQNRLRRSTAGVTGIRAFPVPLQNMRIGASSGAAAYQYTLSGVVQNELYQFAPTLIERLKVTPGFADVTSDLSLGARVVQVNVDRDALARHGVSMETVRQTLYSAFGARTVANVFTAINDYPVIIEANKDFVLDPSVLSRVFVRNSAGQQIRLDTLMSVAMTSGPTAISRKSQLPAVTVSFNLAPGFTLGEATERMREIGRDLNIPATITGQF
ncbi:MAG: efflux RND transporter permease subunit, partial [Rhodoglobus sp.]|nr:efflux RND transporter permease subunit [Rhodoglobus sp.]